MANRERQRQRGKRREQEIEERNRDKLWQRPEQQSVTDKMTQQREWEGERERLGPAVGQEGAQMMRSLLTHVEALQIDPKAQHQRPNKSITPAASCQKKARKCRGSAQVSRAKPGVTALSDADSQGWHTFLALRHQVKFPVYSALWSPPGWGFLWPLKRTFTKGTGFRRAPQQNHLGPLLWTAQEERQKLDCAGNLCRDRGGCSHCHHFVVSPLFTSGPVLDSPVTSQIPSGEATNPCQICIQFINSAQCFAIFKATEGNAIYGSNLNYRRSSANQGNSSFQRQLVKKSHLEMVITFQNELQPSMGDVWCVL